MTDNVLMGMLKPYLTHPMSRQAVRHFRAVTLTFDLLTQSLGCLKATVYILGPFFFTHHIERRYAETYTVPRKKRGHQYFGYKFYQIQMHSYCYYHEAS